MSDNIPTNEKLWGEILDLARGKRKSPVCKGKECASPVNEGKGFTTYPSAYANGWALAQYKRLGGKWRKKASTTGLIQVGENWSGPIYYKKSGGDIYYHFTLPEYAPEIIADGYLRPNFKDDGPSVSGVFAISGSFGRYFPSTQVSGAVKKRRMGEMVAIRFKTKTEPRIGHPEEVIWDKPVKLINPEIIPMSKAASALGAVKAPADDFTVIYDFKKAVALKKEWKSRRASTSPDALPTLQVLLALLRGAHWAHWTSHWQAKGDNSYGDHQLLDRIYTSLIEEIDTLAEKIVGYYGSAGVRPVEQAQLMANRILPRLEAKAEDDPIMRAYIMEEALQKALSNIYNALKDMKALSLGMDDYIMSIANAHETNLYLLRQRLRG